MTVDEAAKKIWDFMHVHDRLEKADLIFVLGSSDTRMAEHAARLYLAGWAPLLLCSGSGSIHNHKPGREKFIGTSEAEVFADIAIQMGVPREAVLIESSSQNSGDNFKFSIRLLKEKGINPAKVIAVQKPYTERRLHAIAKVLWPEVELIASSPSTSFEEYTSDPATRDRILNIMTGDLQRMEEYPKRGFQAVVHIPEDVHAAFEFLISKGYTERLIK